jgi:hypothetical protein
MTKLQPDHKQLSKFIGVMFKHADPGGFVSLRAFYDDEGRPFHITAMPVGKKYPTHNTRVFSRGFILKLLAEQGYLVAGHDAGALAGAIVWVAATSSAGSIITEDCPYTRLHYEISHIVDAETGRRGHNFRLLIDNTDAPIPDWVKEMPPSPVNADEMEET